MSASSKIPKTGSCGDLKRADKHQAKLEVMSPIPKCIATRYLLNSDLGKAAKEVHSNTYRLIHGGYFDAAYRIALAMLTPGPWRLSNKSNLIFTTWHKLLWLGNQLQRDLPPLDDTSEMAQLARKTYEESKQPARKSPFGFLFEEHPKTKGWSSAELDAIVASVRPGNFGGVFNTFQHDAALVLKERVQTRSTQLATAPADPRLPKDHAAIADAVEQGARIAFPKEIATFAMKAAWPAAALDLLDGNRDAAVARLVRLLPTLKLSDDQSAYVAELQNTFDPAFTELFASHALAPTLGLTDAGVDAYMNAFVARSPRTLTAAPSLPWKEVLKRYVARAKEGGIDAEALLNDLQCGEPPSKALAQRAKRGQLLNDACTEEDIATLEARLGAALPLSYREFLLTSDGIVVPEFVSLLPAAQVDWFKNLDTADTIRAWNRDDDEASDEQYAIYGADQDCIHMRPRYLQTALQISTSCDGDVLLLIPDVRFGGEWEAWFLGNKNPGAYRYRSFRDLMEQRVLVDES